MIYVLIDRNNRITKSSERPISSFSDTLTLCEVESLPETYDYLVAENIHEVSKVEGETTRCYKTCSLIPRFYPQPTQSQLKKQEYLKEITKLKKLLSDTDYQAIKYAEGCYTEEDYAPIKAQRQAWRDRINELESITL